MRPVDRLLLCATLASGTLVAGCSYQMNWGDGGGCWSFSGPCGNGSGGGFPVSIEYILGLDASSVDRSVVLAEGGYRAMLRVGDTATLHFVVSTTGDLGHPTDTIRTVTWSATDSSSVTLAPDDRGGLRLIGKKVGRVGRLLANGTYPVMWACAPPYGFGDCTYVTAIDVIPR